MNKLYRQYKKNTKALSPVVASIILIAVTVAVSVVVAAWMSGSIFGLMGTTEKATITNLGFENVAGAAGDSITVSIQNAGDAPVTITQVTLNTQVQTVAGLPLTIQKGALSSAIEITGLDLVPGDQYSVKATTAAGNNLVYNAICP